VKAFALFIAFFATAFSSLADPPTLQELWSHLFTNAIIVWQASTDKLPKSLWIYQRELPRVFSATVISNAVVLASLEHKISPESSTNDFFYHEDMGPNYPCMIPDIFCITPKSATLSFSLPHPDTNTSNIPADEVLVQRAQACAAKLNVDLAQIAFKEMTSRFNQDENGNDLTNKRCGRGVYLSRKLDGILFFGNGEDVLTDGFWIEFGSQGGIRAFSLIWPELQRDKFQPTASTQEIINCIRAHKTIVLPNPDEVDYFARLKRLAGVKKLTITKITPYYGDGVLGEVQTNDEPPRVTMPFAELEAVADFGNSNDTVRLLSPILSSEVSRLLEK
jgi:hypothetical protein